MVVVTEGQYRMRSYQSGTVNVEDMRRNGGNAPYVNIGYRPRGADAKEDDGIVDRRRMEIAEHLAELLNGESDDRSRITRTGEFGGRWDDGTTFGACGPMIDLNPPRCHWVQDERYQAVSARARLIDIVFGIKSSGA